MAAAPVLGGDVDLLWWLVELGKNDREQYRIIRAALWTLYAEGASGRSHRSDKPSDCC